MESEAEEQLLRGEIVITAPVEGEAETLTAVALDDADTAAVVEQEKAPESAWQALVDAWQGGKLPVPSLSGMRPYGEFFSGCSSPPLAPRALANRVATNYELFAANYKAIWLGLVLYSVLVTPTLLFLIAVAAGYGAYTRYWAPGTPKTYTVLGREVVVTDDTRLFAVSTVCGVLGAVMGSAFVLIPATLFAMVVVAGHMVTHTPQEEDLFGEQPRETA